MTTASSMADFLEALERDRLGIREALSLVGPIDHVVLAADATLLEYARSVGVPAQPLEWAVRPSGGVCEAVIVAAATLDAELEWCERIRTHSSARVHGFVWDLLLHRLARRPIRTAEVFQDAPSSPRRLAILTLPRSGSTMLARLLTSCGIGHCREHLRWPLIHLLRRERENAGRIVQRLLHAAECDGWVSTKLVSHYMLELERVYGEGAMYRFLEENAFECVYLRREDKITQALSVFAASVTGKFHAHLFDPEGYRYPPYDFEAICRIFESFHRQELWLAALAARLSSCREVSYEELVRDRAGTIGAILASLGQKGKLLADPGTKRMPRGEALAFAERFRADYRAKFAKDPADPAE
jgi:LPS sulfotransferase NodH